VNILVNFFSDFFRNTEINRVERAKFELLTRMRNPEFITGFLVEICIRSQFENRFIFVTLNVELVRIISDVIRDETSHIWQITEKS